MNRIHRRLNPLSCGSAVLLLFLLIPSGNLHSQTPTGAGNGAEPLNWTAQQDHKNMLDQLGIKALRPGPSGRSGATNEANYDPAKANPFPDLPDPLTLKSGQKVTTPDQWWRERRPEILEDFEREVFGRVPQGVPKVRWTVVSNVTAGLVGTLAANGRQLIGHVDNSSCPSIPVEIQMTLVTPAGAKGPVPVLMMFGGFGGFGGSGMPRAATPTGSTSRAATWPRSPPVRCSGCWASGISR